MYREPKTLLVGLNATYNYLVDRGIVPNAFVCFEVAPDAHVDGLRPKEETTYFISSMCHPTQFETLKGFRRVLWHPWSPEDVHNEAYEECYPDSMKVCGGSTTALRATNIAFALGYRKIDMFGFDCSFTPESGTHCTSKPTDGGPWHEVVARASDGQERSFLTQPYLARQADEFKEFCLRYSPLIDIRVHGDGLTPFMHRTMFPQQYEDAA